MTRPRKHDRHYVVGIFGPSESGKSHIADLLQEELIKRGYDGKTVIYALAHPLKEACRVFKSEKGGPEWRALICGIGDVVRKIKIDWLWDLFIENILSHYVLPTVFILNDPRYKDQAAHCDLTIKLVRSTAKSKMTIEESIHATEMAWGYIDTDYTLPNEDPEDPAIIVDMLADRIVKELGEDF